MLNRVKCFLKSEKGINTVEVVILLAIMVGLAIVFRQQIGTFANGIMDSLFNNTNITWSDMENVK
ncbi:MAG: hypothetical protein GX236_00470 [Clostridiaceae bacterium]|jgi:Flp pilus assembly pilin Flp|nr:hypothetical protein [Clostridiaceae bacterium]